jgi:pullulanase/glycogen debranching enzyme
MKTGRNWINGQNNQDGMDDNYSWNCGQDGDEGVPSEVRALRGLRCEDRRRAAPL